MGPKNLFVLYVNTVTASCHGTKDSSTCKPFCYGIMSSADRTVLMPVAVDCLMKWAEIPAPGYLWDQLRSPSIWKLRGLFFPGKCFGNGWSPRVIFCTMVVDWAFIDFIKLYLMFPHQFWILHLSIGDGWRCRQETTTGHRWRASPLLLSWNLQKCVRRTVFDPCSGEEVRIRVGLLPPQCESTGSSILLFCVSCVIQGGLISDYS